jgi:UDP-N-acetylglucosamine--N-acetylmuramyl-(pentapeptide) pyrophosphoryl-undecaprenol N-acetylglucosamine transferase
MGGSQGSGILNASVASMLDAHASDRGLAIRHAVGERFLAAAAPPRDGRGGVLYQPLGYEPQMPLVYAAADLLVGRGGASTVHEVAVTGVPAILVPWSGAAGDHQTENVRWLADEGGAVLLPEAHIDELEHLIERLRTDARARDDLSDRARSMGEVHRTGALAELVAAVALA